MKEVMAMRYTLMHKAIPVAEITLDDCHGNILSVDALHNKAHLPVGIAVIETSLWCGVATDHIRAHAFTKSKTFYQYHGDQIELVTSFDWLDLSELDDIEEAFAGILADNSVVDRKRRSALSVALRQRVELLDNIIRERRGTPKMQMQRRLNRQNRHNHRPPVQRREFPLCANDSPCAPW
jgi:hypothetical protein